MIDIKNLTIRKAHESLVKKEFTVLDLVKEYKKVIDEKNHTIHAYLEVFSDIEEQAKITQELIDSGKATLLTGIPIALKDNIMIENRGASA